MAFAHTPYDGSAAPFTIGLKPLDPAEWIEPDGDLEAYLAQKDRLYAEIPDRVFVAEPDTEGAQAEVLALLAGHLPVRFPERYETRPGTIAILGTGRAVPLDGEEAPLRLASLLVQEDLVLMRRSEAGWRLAAASLCFPSSWSLMEKFGRPLADIHAPVPAFGRGTRNAALIERIFDNMRPEQPVWRMNWSLQEDAELHHPRSKTERDARVKQEGATFLGPKPAAAAFIRVERQTLRKLPKSGDILFTIRIYLDPLERLRRHPERARLASALADQLSALDPGQLIYKGLADDRDGLVETLNAIAHG